MHLVIATAIAIAIGTIAETNDIVFARARKVIVSGRADNFCH